MRVLTCSSSGNKPRSRVVEVGRWYFQAVNYPAPWISDEDLAEAKRRDKGTRYNRLWKGQWTSGKGDALTADIVEACIHPAAKPASKPRKGWQFVGGLDLGINNDHAGIVVVGVSTRQRRIKLAYCRDFAPNKKRKNGKVEVDLILVRDTVKGISKKLDIDWFGYDPHQAVLMAQELEEEDVPMEEMTFVGKNLTAMALALVTCFTDGIIELYPDDHLLSDLGKLSIIEKPPAGFKLEATRDATGHADVATALAICLPEAMSRLADPLDPSLVNRELMLPDPNEEPLTDQEVDELPDFLRDIVEAHRDHKGGSRRND